MGLACVNKHRMLATCTVLTCHCSCFFFILDMTNILIKMVTQVLLACLVPEELPSHCENHFCSHCRYMVGANLWGLLEPVWGWFCLLNCWHKCAGLLFFSSLHLASHMSCALFEVDKCHCWYCYWTVLNCWHSCRQLNISQGCVWCHQLT